MLSACSSIVPSGPDRGERDWAAYAAGLYTMSESERLAAYTDAARRHAASPSDGSAIRLAIASLGIDSPVPDYESVLSLLAYAQSNAANDANRAFARLLRPIVQRLADQEVTLAAANRDRRSLEQQLEALKQLEEELNAGGEPR